MSQLYYFSGGKSDYWIPFTLKLGFDEFCDHFFRIVRAIAVFVNYG